VTYRWLSKPKWTPSTWLAIATVVLVCITVVVQAQTPPNVLASAILQACALIFSVGTAYVFGRQSTAAAAQELIKPHAASAFRRMLNLYKGLGRIRNKITSISVELSALRKIDDPSLIEFQHVTWVIQMLDAMVLEQVATGEDALDDWRDLAPDEVARIEQQLPSERPASDELGSN